MKNIVHHIASNQRGSVINVALLILIPLAITSSRRWIKRLGKNWRRLHRLVYLADLLAVLHFLLLVKADHRRPLVYGAIVVALLVVRIPFVRDALSSIRRSKTSP